MITVNIADPATGQNVGAPLRDGAILSGLPVGATIVAAGESGPMTFVLDKLPPRIEASPPYCLTGDDNGKLAPLKLDLGEHLLTVIHGPSHTREVIRFTVQTAPVGALPVPRSGFNTPAPAASPAIIVKPAVGPAGPDEPPLADGAKRIMVAAGEALAPALAQVRDGAGDRVYLQRGGTWPQGLGWAASGQPGKPSGILCYGDASKPRPRLIPASVSGISLGKEGMHDLILYGLDVVARGGVAEVGLDKNRTNLLYAGLFVAKPCKSLTVRGSVFRGFEYGVGYQHQVDKTKLSQGHAYIDCRFVDNWSLTKEFQGQGCYVAFATDVSFTRCVAAGNGRVVGTDAGESGYRHGWYVQGSADTGNSRITFDQCGAVDNAGYGIMSRADGTKMRGNLSVGNSVSYLLSSAVSVLFDGNAAVPGGHLARMSGGQSYGGGGLDYHCAAGTVTNNVFLLPASSLAADKNLRKPAMEIGPRTGDVHFYAGSVSVSGSQNVFAGWPADRTFGGPDAAKAKAMPSRVTATAPTINVPALVARLKSADTVSAAAEITKLRQLIPV